MTYNKNMSNSLYVSSPVNALVQGILREDKTLSEILSHGNFGLGTFNDLDGEMVLADGIFYQLKSDGSVAKASLDGSSPYACVTHFEAIEPINLHGLSNYLDLQNIISQAMLSPNLIYAVRVEGLFSSIHARSVPKQHCYRPLVDVAGDQVEFNFESIAGQLVGYWTPDFMGSVTVPGFHLHFLSDDKLHGGHLLDCALESGVLWLQSIDQLTLDLPHSADYLKAQLIKDTFSALNKAEH
jgi:acetolactate decarboxylase